MKILILLLIFSLVVFTEEKGKLKRRLGRRESDIQQKPLKTTCGNTKFNDETGRRKRLTNGETAKRGEWPWIVSLFYNHNSNTKTEICVGTLLSKRWVLTAAKCFEPSVDHPHSSADPDKWTVLVEYDKLEQDASEPGIGVEEITFHLKTPNNKYDDFALVKLKERVKFNAYVHAACLPDEDDSPGIDETCYSVGFGYESTVLRSTIRHAAVRVITNSECESEFEKLLPIKHVEIVPTLMCTGVNKGDEGACRQDMGGPLMCERNGQWFISGVLMVASVCGDTTYPAVYARVPIFMRWIKEVTSIQ